MNFTFPEIKTTRTTEEQKRKILDEIHEFDSAEYEELCETGEHIGGQTDAEAIDILHAVETFIRVHFRGREELLDELVKEVIAKNTARGYYSKKCF